MFSRQTEPAPLLVDSPSATELADDRQWWRIYEDSIPASEREPRDIILASLLRDVGKAFRVRAGGSTLGLGTTHLLTDPPAVFLVYLAVDRAQRSRGLGGRLLEYAWTESARGLRAQGHDPLGLVWEVDDPAAAEGPQERRVRDRRVHFFTRHGGAALPWSYRQPPVNGPGPVPMRLMWRPAPGQMTPDETGTAALVRAIYFGKYGAINRIPAAVLQEMLNRSVSSQR